MTSWTRFVVLASLPLTFTVLIVVTHRASAERQTASVTQSDPSVIIGSMGLAVAPGKQQLRERSIYKRSDFSPPVKITLAKTKNRGSIRFEQKFIDDEDWLKGLTVSLDNSSGKSFIYARIEIKFPPPEGQERALPAIYPLEYGDNPLSYKTEDEMPPRRVKPVLPGKSLEITLSDDTFNDLEFFLKAAGYIRGTNAVELRITDIGFTDGTVWNLGRILRRDPKSLWGWSPLSRADHRGVQLGRWAWDVFLVTP